MVLQLFEEVSQELRRGRSLCETYRKAHAKTTDGYWRFQESIKRAADDERLLAKAAAEREQRIAMKRKMHLALEAEELIQNAHNERVQMQARQAAAFFTSDLRAKLKEDLQGLSVASVEIEQTFSGLQQQAMRIKAVVEAGGGGDGGGGGAAGGVQGENEGVMVVLRGMLRQISDFLLDNVGPFRGLRDMANVWAKEGLEDKEKDGCGIPPEFMKELGCASPDSSPSGGKAKTGPPRRPPPPPPPEESDDDDDDVNDDGEDEMMEAVKEDAVAAVLEELGVETCVSVPASVSEGRSADVARGEGGDESRGGHLRGGGRQQGLSERERENGGFERGMEGARSGGCCEDDEEEEGEGEMLARLLGGACLDGDEEGPVDEAKAVENQLDLLEALLGPDD